jgi:hypothetical protein
MNRRQLVAGMLGTLIGGCDQGNLSSMSNAPPEKIRLVPIIGTYGTWDG